MSPELKAALARVQSEPAKPVTKKEDNTPKNWGYPTNKRISFTANWRK